MTKKDVTFVIPIFNLKEDRLNNLKFVLSQLFKTGNKIVLAEQVEKDSSNISDIVKEITKDYSNFLHVLYVHPSKSIHKTGIINWATKVFVKTKYAWVNDVDFYMKFEKVLDSDWNEKFIKPYGVAKKLNKQDSQKIINGKTLQVDFSDRSTMYISLYSALSFIYEKNAFLNIGGMDVNIFGWGKEDCEFNRRVRASNISIQEFDHKGIHLWHPIASSIAAQERSVINNQDMAVVTCHFNWGKFINPVRNLNRFIHQMKSEQIPLFGVELSLTDEFETSGLSGWKQIQVSKENVFFQKEACINLAINKLIPETYTKIAWIDADIYFTNKNWYNDASEKLNEYKVIQLYANGIKTDRYGRFLSKHTGAIFSYLNISSEKRNDLILSNIGDIGYPGAAMAARRDLWKHGGLYPYRILGGGDTAFIAAMFKHDLNSSVDELFKERYNGWKRKIFEYVDSSISYIEGEFIHEWHGDVADRKYADRYSILKESNTNYIQLNDDGIVQNYGNRQINDLVLEYFKNRNEDGDTKLERKNTSRRVVYTCISGNYDALKEVISPEENIDYICFSDNIIRSETWKIKLIPKCLKHLDNVKMARCMKILPHLFLPEYDISVWVDGNIQVVGDINKFIDNNLINYFAIPKHPDRICVYDEANAVVNLNKDSVDIVDKQMVEYINNNYPKNNGMVQSNIIIRKHNDKRCVSIANSWWTEVRQYSRRDQLSFNYSIWKKNVIIDILNPNIIVSDYFQIWTHPKRGGDKVSLRKNYGDIKNYINGVEV